MTAWPPQVVLATRNLKKQKELQRILSSHGIDTAVQTLADYPDYIDDVVEDAADFEGNALLKARAVHRALGVAAIADDSGLCVDALNGMPGILSARWAGRHGDDTANLQLVLNQCKDIPAERRGAQFVAVVVYVAQDGREFTTRGEMSGRLIDGPRGDHGFGYDPIFIADGETITNAQLSPERKDALSHRGKALSHLIGLLAN